MPTVQQGLMAELSGINGRLTAHWRCHQRGQAATADNSSGGMTAQYSKHSHAATTGDCCRCCSCRRGATAPHDPAKINPDEIPHGSSKRRILSFVGSTMRRRNRTVVMLVRWTRAIQPCTRSSIYICSIARPMVANRNNALCTAPCVVNLKHNILSGGVFQNSFWCRQTDGRERERNVISRGSPPPQGKTEQISLLQTAAGDRDKYIKYP